jgi:hypothetical protein
MKEKIPAFLEFEVGNITKTHLFPHSKQKNIQSRAQSGR